MEVTSAASTGGFYNWILVNGQLIAFFAQILYWLLMVVFVGYAVAIYKTYTNYLMGKGKAGKARLEADKPADAVAEKVSVDQFVD